MASGKANRDFETEVLGDILLLDRALKWINDNMTIDQVFTNDDIKTFLDDEMPEKFYSKDALEAWAEDNGFVKVAS